MQCPICPFKRPHTKGALKHLLDTGGKYPWSEHNAAVNMQAQYYFFAWSKEPTISLPCGFQGLPPDVVSAMTRHSQVGGTPGTCFCWNLYVPEISGIKWRASTPAFSDSLNWVVHRLNNKTFKHLVKIYCQTPKLAKLADAILELLVVSCLFKICISFPSKNKTGFVNACMLY